MIPAPSTGMATAKRPLTLGKQLTLSSFWFSINFQFAGLLPIIIPLEIIPFVAPGSTGNAQQALFLAWLSALGAITAIIVQPLTGALSDRTYSRFGRRRPYITIGTFIMLAGIAMIILTHEVWFFVAGFLIINVANNICTAAYQGLLPDLVPDNQRGSASGYLGLMTILGNVGSLAIAGVLLSNVGEPPSSRLITQGSDLFYIVTGAAMVLGMLITIFGVREPRRVRAVSTSLQAVMTRGQRLRHFWLDPWQHRNFAWVFFTRASVMMGLALFTTYIQYYFAKVAQVPNFTQATAAIAVLALCGAIFSALVLGILSDRIGRVSIVFFATACMTVPALAFTLLPQNAPLVPLGIFFGLGFGAYTSVDWALAIDSLPTQDTAGKDLGIWSLASNTPSILAPLVGGSVIYVADHFGDIAFGYRAVFALAALFLTLGAVFVLGIREQRGKHLEVMPQDS